MVDRNYRLSIYLIISSLYLKKSDQANFIMILNQQMFSLLFKNRYFQTGFAMFFFVFLSQPVESHAQVKVSSGLYEQASELTTLIIGYGRDVEALSDFYAPRQMNRFVRGERIVNSPIQIKRLEEINRDYLNTLSRMDFNHLNVNGKVDYILLKKKIQENVNALAEEKESYAMIEKYIPFASKVYGLEYDRFRGKKMEGEQVASLMNALQRELTTLEEEQKTKPEMDMKDALFGQKAVKGIQARLKNVFDFYNGYDPMFTWWVPVPYEELDSALNAYASGLAQLGKVHSIQKKDKSGIMGVPIGRDELTRQLRSEMISYSPEELIEIANKEFAWCDEELLKASQEMGFGNDWRKAQEQVKNSYVPTGHQPELILKLYNDAKSFITGRDLITWPTIADETWGMIMMSPERQLVNPFFTGGREISISYPTNTMTHDDKLMSMRGNNPFFSRGTVQHELLPGHHLQYYMNSRYKNYRSTFSTPFNSEGWALYWELLLYDMDFAKTPEERIGMLFWRMHRCARIIFSLQYHLGNWSPQECIDFLVDRVGHEVANAEGEVRRSFEGGYSPLYQVAYLVGGIQIMGLKQELVDSGKMTYKEFHDAFMKENSLPIEMMRAILTDEPLKESFETNWKFYKN